MSFSKYLVILNSVKCIYWRFLPLNPESLFIPAHFPPVGTIKMLLSVDARIDTNVTIYGSFYRFLLQ